MINDDYNWRTTLVSGLYWIMRSCMMRQYAVVLSGTFSLHSNSNRTSTVALLTDSFCREQSMITNGPLSRNFVRVRFGSRYASVIVFGETRVRVVQNRPSISIKIQIHVVVRIIFRVQIEFHIG